jgi:AAA15 family ATPase/GTPase
MLQKLTLQNFRRFQDFELQQLGRINLLVGENNSGKTSILEAISLLYSGGDLQSLTTLITNRGEFSWNREKSVLRQIKLSISHLFYNHHTELSSSFSIVGITKKQETIKLHACLQEETNNANGDKSIDLFDRAIDLDLDTKDLYSTNIYLLVDWLNKEQQKSRKYKLIHDGEFFLYSGRASNREIEDLLIKLHFITSSSLKKREIINLFNQIVLTPEEELVYQALRNIEPDILFI